MQHLSTEIEYTPWTHVCSVSDKYLSCFPSWISTTTFYLPPASYNFSNLMPDARTNAIAALRRRELGSLFDSELWWRDHYRDLESRGYRLRPRYSPDWQPSWKQSGIDFFRVEDGQPTLVSVVSLMPSLLKLPLSCLLQWTQRAIMTESKSCSRAFLREEDRN